MTFINKILLAFVLLPSPLYRSWGINTDQLKAILTAKLTMDDRRPNTIQATRQQRNGKKEISNATLGTMFISLLMGAMFLFSFMLGNDYTTKLTLYYSLFIVMLAMTLVSDFTSVLIDVRDNYIILPKPVNDRTFLIARLLHIFIHLCKLVVPMCLPAFIYLWVKTNALLSVLFTVVDLFAILLSIFLINAVYIIILRITTAQKFKNIIANIQIGFAISIYASYQVLPRIVEQNGLLNFEVPKVWWMLLVPPYWFASAFNVLLVMDGTALEWMAAALAFIVPVISIVVVIRFLAPAFNQKLAMISGGESAPTPIKTNSRPVRENAGQTGFWAALLTHTAEEKTGFLFTWKLMARSRDFKIRVYPGIGYMVVILILPILSGNFHFNTVQQEDGFQFKQLIPIYFFSLPLMIILSQVKFSEQFKAAWMFVITPVTQPGLIISGAVKAVMVRFYFYMVLAALAFGLVVGGPSILPNIVLALLNLLIIGYIIAILSVNQIPFSQPRDESDQGGRFAKSIMVMSICAVIGVLHGFLFWNMVATGIGIVIALIAIWLLDRYIKGFKWTDLKMAE
jgi:hypothetical protein